MRLQYSHPNEELTDIAVMLLDSEENSVGFGSQQIGIDMMKTKFEILTALKEDIRYKATDIGATELVAHLLETLSNAILITEPELITTNEPQLEIDALYSFTWILFTRGAKVLQMDTADVGRSLVTVRTT